MSHSDSAAFVRAALTAVVIALGSPVVSSAAPLVCDPVRGGSVKVDECQRIADDWRRQAAISALLLSITAILGGAIAAVQGIQSSKIKTATVIMGAIVSTVTIVNTATLDGDYKSLRRRATQGDILISGARQWLSSKDAVTTDDDRDGILQEVETRVSTFQQLAGAAASATQADVGGDAAGPIRHRRRRARRRAAVRLSAGTSTGAWIPVLLRHGPRPVDWGREGGGTKRRRCRGRARPRAAVGHSSHCRARARRLRKTGQRRSQFVRASRGRRIRGRGAAADCRVARRPPGARGVRELLAGRVGGSGDRPLETESRPIVDGNCTTRSPTRSVR